MKQANKQLQFAFAALIGLAGLQGCSRADGNTTGREYMPDMAHSVAYESNTYVFYNQNRWGGAEGYRAFYDKNVLGGKPITHTIARGQKEHVYHYNDTEADRTRAMAEITENQLKPQTEQELEKILESGKNLYGIYCATCHGDQGDGNGNLYKSGEGPYPNKPANYMADEFLKATDGRYYHAIVYGKNVMMPHADKLSPKERWEVIHYIRSMQATYQKGTYDLAAANGKKTAPESVAPAPAPAPAPEAPAPNPKEKDKKKTK